METVSEKGGHGKLRKTGDGKRTLKGKGYLSEAGNGRTADYAVIGGMALVAHGYRRFTEDVDILMTPEMLRTFRDCLVGRGYLPAFTGATKSFRDTQTGVRIKIVTAGEYPGDGNPKPVSFPKAV
jgi:hypothetical protein